MRIWALTAAALVASTLSVPAQQTDGARDIEEGLGLLQEGARRLLDGLVGEVEPTMRELAEALRGFDFSGIDIDDLGAYHPPEVMPNGDIILRRRVPLPIESPLDGETET